MVICFALGLWQWERRAWKEAQLQVLKKCERSDFVSSLPSQRRWQRLVQDDWSFRRVRFSGVFTQKKALLWRDGSFHIIQAFKLEDGFILVDRGSSPKPRPKSRVMLEAVLYPSAVRRFFDPQDDLVSGQWFVRDIGKMAKALDVAPIFSYMADLSKTCPKPRNVHLQYALTWWLLMLLLPLIAFAGVQRKEQDG